MLTLTFLGVGSAFAKRNFHSNALLEAWTTGPDSQTAPDETLLIDFGATGPMALHTLKDKPGFGYLDRDGAIQYPAIRRLFVTHLHSDHTGGIEELAMSCRYQRPDPATGRPHRPQLLVPADLLKVLWENCLQGGLSAQRDRPARLDNYFDVVALRAIDPTTTESFSLLSRYELTPVRTDHVTIRQRYDWPSYGLRIRELATGRTVFFSGDTRFDPSAFEGLFEESDLIFHEVQLEDQPEPVHALLSELRTLPAAIRRKMLLYHYSDVWDNGSYDYVATEFAGFARPHHRYTLVPARPAT